MIQTFCDDIISVYTHCSGVEAVYTYGELVWPTGPTPPGVWYVSWIPTDLSGSFYMDGVARNLEDYSGYYSWSGSGSINSEAFTSLAFTYMETNVISINDASRYSKGAFAYCVSLSQISLSRCRSVGSYAFCETGLLQVSLSRCRYIGDYAFSDCASISQLSLPRCSYIGKYAFFSCSSLESLDLPRCKYIGNVAFDNTRISQISLPVCEYIGSMALAFNSCESIYLPACSYIGSSAFAWCSSLTQANLPACEYVGSDAFNSCPALSQISLPVCSVINGAAFTGCKFIEVDLPKCNTLAGGGVFKNNIKLLTISLPECEYLTHHVFYNCLSFQVLDLPVCSYIGGSAFNNCGLFSRLILRSNTVCTLSTSGCFVNTPFANCSGSILVPPSLVDAYKSAPGWSSLSCIIQPLLSEPKSYYISWSPGYRGASFSIDGVSYYEDDYYNGSDAGYFPYLFGGVITSSAFINSPEMMIETNAYRVEDNAFLFASVQLSVLSLSACEYLGNSACWSCYKLTSIYLPVCSYIGNFAFAHCSSLTSIDLPGCSYIGYYAFSGCSALNVITLGNTSVCEINGSRVFSGTQITNSTGSILVPASLVDAYKDDSVWSHFSNRIFPIPE